MQMYPQKVISRKNKQFFVDILKVNDENSRIRIRGSVHVPLAYESGSCFFLSVADKMQTKQKFFFIIVFAYYFLKVHLHHSSKKKKSKKKVAK
jgi:hypothetical protein